jgi:hypothetical protein
MENNQPSAEKSADIKTVMVLLAPEKVKTIVVMDVPEGPLLCCQLEDLTLKPERGSSYVLDGRLFDVERAIEVIGVYKHGSHLSTDEQLLGLLKLLSGQEQSAVRLASMRNIGKEQQTAGGIILAVSLSFTDGADRLVYLKLRQVNTTTALDGMRQLARDAMDRGGSTTGAGKGEGEKHGE